MKYNTPRMDQYEKISVKENKSSLCIDSTAATRKTQKTKKTIPAKQYEE
jgi:hypothetical protein